MTARRMRKLGPADHGRVIPYEQYKFAPWQEGYQYELVDGKLYVFPSPEAPQVFVEGKVRELLDRYSRSRPEVIDYVSIKCRVYVPNRPGVTSLAPDIAAYRDYPPFDQLRNLHWRDIHPLLVAEVVSREDPDKDLVRNVELYLQVPSIREYWLVDTCEDPDRPTMLVYRRRGNRWQRVIKVAYGETYTTKLLPGFELLLDPHQ